MNQNGGVLKNSLIGLLHRLVVVNETKNATTKNGRIYIKLDSGTKTSMHKDQTQNICDHKQKYGKRPKYEINIVTFRVLNHQHLKFRVFRSAY